MPRRVLPQTSAILQLTKIEQHHGKGSGDRRPGARDRTLRRIENARVRGQANQLLYSSMKRCGCVHEGPGGRWERDGESWLAGYRPGVLKAGTARVRRSRSRSGCFVAGLSAPSTRASVCGDAYLHISLLSSARLDSIRSCNDGNYEAAAYHLSLTWDTRGETRFSLHGPSSRYF